MNILQDSIMRITDDINFYQLNQFYPQEVWNFYKIYTISLCITGIKDNKIKNKNLLISNFIKKLVSGKVDWKLYEKINNYMKNDNAVISRALEQFKEEESENIQMGDKYVAGTLGISIWD